MYAGPLAESAVTASMCFSSTTTVRPTTSNMWQVMATSSALACLPLQIAVMPAPCWHGVFGMARMTGTLVDRFFSIMLVGTDAATETINCFVVMWPLISRTTSSTTCGFTPITIMSAPLIASTLSVPTFTFNFAASDFARSSCATVARVDFGESEPFFSNACRIIPPILPAPRNATFFPARSLAIIFLGIECHYESFNHRWTQSFTEEETATSLTQAYFPPSTNALLDTGGRSPLHPVPCRRHHVAQSAFRLPLQQRLRFRRIRDQSRRISRAARSHLARNLLSGYLLDCGNHFLH